MKQGQLQKQLTEDALINMLETQGQEEREKKVAYKRRAFDSDSDDNDDDLY